MALGLHDFYTGLELVFSKIATVVDGKMPSSKEWHRDLLVQMSSDIPTTRPPVISEEIVQNLDQYRRFRMWLEVSTRLILTFRESNH
jgi:hypothetical protein